MIGSRTAPPVQSAAAIVRHRLSLSVRQRPGGALRGRAALANFLYLFKNGRYLRLNAATMIPAGPDAGTEPAWGLPADWTSFDAVLPGRGAKIEFCYFFRGQQYIRFDWAANAPSSGYPKFIWPEWHMTAPFD